MNNFTELLSYCEQSPFCESSNVERVQFSADELLSERQAQLFRMYYIYGLNYGKISDALGIDKSTVARTLHRAKTNLKQCIAYAPRADII